MAIELNNYGGKISLSVSKVHDLYYPRLQINQKGEIVLALSVSENGILTRGILVDKKIVDGKESTVPIGTKFSDWEVGGELKDYDGEVTVTFKNKIPNNVE